jgi:hypothetical protein
MIVTLDAASLPPLTEQVRAEAERHPARSPERRAAAALYVALTTTSSVDAARKALTGFTTPEVEADALALLHQLAAQTTAAIAAAAPTEGTPT